ncbi:MAG: SDR family oxidoreductase [Clostridiales bacterium]|nr:SDR family oxidoreductase [Clostridiales bacterium]
MALGPPVSIPQLKSIYDMMSLKGRTAFITGGGGGIGSASAAGMAEAGANIMLMDIPEAEDRLKECTQQIIDRYGAKASYVTGDVSSEADMIRMINKTVDEFGGLDICFSNAGVGLSPDNPTDMPIDVWQRMLDVNLTGMFLAGRTAALKMIECGTTNGSLIFTASMSGLIINQNKRGVDQKHMVAYAATKAATIHLAKSFAVNYGHDNIRSNSISPGLIHSGLHARMGRAADNNPDSGYDNIPLNRWGTLNEMVGLLLFLSSDLSSYVTGANIVIDGGYTVW